MRYRLRPGDYCPHCREQLAHYRRSIWTLFLQESYLGCARCGFTAYKRSRHRPLIERRYAAHDGIFNMDVQQRPKRKFPIVSVTVAGLLLAALIYSLGDIIPLAARIFKQAIEDGFSQKAVDALMPALNEQQTTVVTPAHLISLPFEVVLGEPVSQREPLRPDLTPLGVRHAPAGDGIARRAARACQ